MKKTREALKLEFVLLNDLDAENKAKKVPGLGQFKSALAAAKMERGLGSEVQIASGLTVFAFNDKKLGDVAKRAKLMDPEFAEKAILGHVVQAEIPPTIANSPANEIRQDFPTMNGFSAIRIRAPRDEPSNLPASARADSPLAQLVDSNGKILAQAEIVQAKYTQGRTVFEIREPLVPQ